MSEYTRMAEQFCKTTGTKVSVVYVNITTVPWDKSWQYHNHYIVRLDRNHRTMRVHFYDSLHNTREGKRPTKYDVLAALTKSDPGTFSEFCAEFGYTEWAECYEVATREGYDKHSYQIYKAVLKEWNNVNRLFGDVLSDLADIA